MRGPPTPRLPAGGNGHLRRRRFFASADLAVLVGVQLLAGLTALAVLRLLTFHPGALPALAVAAPVAVLLVARPWWVAPTFLALAWTLLGERVLGDPDPVAVAALVFLVAVAWQALRRVELALEALLVSVLLGIPMLAAGLLGSGGAHVGLEEVADLAFLLVAALTLTNAQAVTRALTALALVGAVLGVGAVYSVVGEPSSLFPVTAHGAQHAAGPAGDPRQLALLLAALAPLAAALALTGGTRRIVGVAALFCLPAGILATGSLGGLVLAVAALAVFAVARRRRAPGVALLLPATLALALVLIPAPYAGGSSKRFVQPGHSDNDIALEVFRDHPLVGVGPGRYPAVYADYAGKQTSPSSTVREPRSLPLQIAAEQGVVGLVGWCGAALVLFRTAALRRAWRTEPGRALLSSAATYLVGSLFLNGGDLRPLFLLVGMTLAIAAALPRSFSPLAR